MIGFDEVPDLSQAGSKEDMQGLCRRAYPDASDKQIANFAGQLLSFAHRMEPGDIVALPRKTTPVVALGRVTGPYALTGGRHTRQVEWVRPDVPRTSIGQDLLYSLGAFITVCRITRNDAEARFESMIREGRDPGAGPSPDDDGEGLAVTDVERLAQDQILARIQEGFKGHDLARLVEAVLEAEGYVTRLSPPGPDGGVDILAGRGAMGFEAPKLCVQVKSSQSPTDVNLFRALQGTMNTFQADQGLFVSWGGFTRPVLDEARLSFFSVRLWDANALVEAILRNYDQFPEDLQTELPLKRLWALVVEE